MCSFTLFWRVGFGPNPGKAGLLNLHTRWDAPAVGRIQWVDGGLFGGFCCCCRIPPLPPGWSHFFGKVWRISTLGDATIETCVWSVELTVVWINLKVSLPATVGCVPNGWQVWLRHPETTCSQLQVILPGFSDAKWLYKHFEHSTMKIMKNWMDTNLNTCGPHTEETKDTHALWELTRMRKLLRNGVQ